MMKHLTDVSQIDDNECVCVELLQSCPTLCEHMDCSPPDSSVHGILQARIPEQVAISFSSNNNRYNVPHFPIVYT